MTGITPLRREVTLHGGGLGLDCMREARYSVRAYRAPVPNRLESLGALLHLHQDGRHLGHGPSLGM